VSRQPIQRGVNSPGHSAKTLPDGQAEAQARKKVRALWQPGALFHNCARFPRKPNVPRVDRLAGILRQGLVAPAVCPEGSVCSDLNLTVTGVEVPYDSLVFLHRFGPLSFLYTICQPGHFAVFVDPELPVLAPEAMGPNWVVLCRDEVYVRERVAPEKLTGIAIHPADGEAIISELPGELRRCAIPLYDYQGNVLWPPDDGA
jgi:hypothetical protein